MKQEPQSVYELCDLGSLLLGNQVTICSRVALETSADAFDLKNLPQERVSCHMLTLAEAQKERKIEVMVAKMPQFTSRSTSLVRVLSTS